MRFGSLASLALVLLIAASASANAKNKAVTSDLIRSR